MITRFRALHSCQAGNVSMLFAVAIVPLLMCAGTAIDYVEANRAETQMRAALDSAAMAVASSNESSAAKRKTIGKNYFQNALQGTPMAGVEPDVGITGDIVTVKAQYNYPTSFMMLAGIGHMPITAEAEVALGHDSNAEVVMVLDYSYSMVTNNKYMRMRDAASKMVKQLNDSDDEDSAWLKVGVVPFSAMVHTSMAKEYVTQASATPTWTGCTQDRKYPWNLGVETPDASANSKWGHIDGGFENESPYTCAVYAANQLKIVPLTDDLDSIETKLDDMYPVGNTNIALGAEFGWNLLDPDFPYDEAQPYSDKLTKKFMVLLTDGDQTSKQWDADGNRSDEAGEANLLKLCANMGQEGITIFAIAYDITTPALTDLLKTCAGDNYFEASTSGNEITKVFDAITTRIKKSTLRLSR